MASNSLIKQVKILRIISETKVAKTFVLEPLEGWQPTYKEGQFLTLVFYTRHGEKRRSYSISSSPSLNEPLSITVKKVDNGEFSRLLLMNAKIGDMLYTSGINGLFVLPGNFNASNQFFFLAAGSGITPCFSLLKRVLKQHSSKVVLIYSNKSEADALFLDQLENLQREFADRFKIHFLFSYKLDLYHSRLSSWLLQQLLERYLKVDNKDAFFYLCGPLDYMRMVNIALLGNIPPGNIFKESFSSEPRQVVPIPEDTSPHQVTILFRGQKRVISVQFPHTILSAAKSRNINLPYSCETGRCGSCLALCKSGQVWMAYNEVLTDEEVALGQILLCQSYPIKGDVEVVI
ncbi:ring-1,2-phenylacetyl-CoA epoxidase subunit PaaE [Arcticibacter pallidicorallinus]|uniref:Ring-1,2-phenylacetyl-CoA epoxidase subunit PaaE n=1 Tax=Arcticibacter pallidicorallinus TaxID=1259464 RepID=A0A2T0U0X0_9SPHI|nr:iron-sulfur cluster-binding domain-containing protein [Arcticibacter pallidicorallinus]PRY51596.1 ring-1,2-phenylacetyl-CoA epoxidase subunit PaaE [Arcticibacter pallidicorallinus]